jgi:hypothetical protein
LKKSFFAILLLTSLFGSLNASRIIIPMDEVQKNHLKAYGIAYWVISKDLPVDWMLNYRGGSFSFIHADIIEKECIIRGVSYEIVSDQNYQGILAEISRNDVNQDVIKLEVAPKIAVYSPKSKLPWDDAVTLVLTYAEIPYDVVYDSEILTDQLPKYNWLHLHHEDFTGQYGKFYAQYRGHEWYQKDQAEQEAVAKSFNFNLDGVVMASDAFFPFPDCVEIAFNEGIKSVIQPGGSIKDQLSIDFCNENKISMIFTGTRHFKH